MESIDTWQQRKQERGQVISSGAGFPKQETAAKPTIKTSSSSDSVVASKPSAATKPALLKTVGVIRSSSISKCSPIRSSISTPKTGNQHSTPLSGIKPIVS